MHSRLFSFCVCVSVILLSASYSAAADLASAKRAYEQKDYVTAAKEYMALAEQGNEDAQLAIAKMFMMGEGVERDNDQALKWFKPLATLGNAEAQFYLGSMYLLPRKDLLEGMKWLRLSAAQGMQDAQYLLGKAYMQGADVIPQDRIQGGMWLRLAARDNHEFYQNELAAAERRMSVGEIEKAKALAQEWKPVTRDNAKPRD